MRNRACACRVLQNRGNRWGELTNLLQSTSPNHAGHAIDAAQVERITDQNSTGMIGGKKDLRNRCEMKNRTCTKQYMNQNNLRTLDTSMYYCSAQKKAWFHLYFPSKTKHKRAQDTMFVVGLHFFQAQYEVGSIFEEVLRRALFML